MRLTEFERGFFKKEISKLEMWAAHPTTLASGQTARAVTAHFLDAAISVSLKSSMCYLHCMTNTDGSERDLGTSPPNPNQVQFARLNTGKMAPNQTAENVRFR